MSNEIKKISEEQALDMFCDYCMYADKDNICPDFCQSSNGFIDFVKKAGYIEQSAVERWEEIKKIHNRIILLQEYFAVADAAIKELQEKTK